MQPEEVRDDTALRWALEHSVILRVTDIPPCEWVQAQPCRNLGFDRGPDGGFYCLPHYEISHRLRRQNSLVVPSHSRL